MKALRRQHINKIETHHRPSDKGQESLARQVNTQVITSGPENCRIFAMVASPAAYRNIYPKYYLKHVYIRPDDSLGIELKSSVNQEWQFFGSSSKVTSDRSFISRVFQLPRLIRLCVHRNSILEMNPAFCSMEGVNQLTRLIQNSYVCFGYSFYIIKSLINKIYIYSVWNNRLKFNPIILLCNCYHVIIYNLEKMSIKRSEQYFYFQNKAHHYDNLRNIKSVIGSKPTKAMRNTIEHTSTKKRNLTPYLKDYQIKQQNEYMMNRLFNIMNSKKSTLNKLDSYSRYNKIQRNFKNKVPHREQVSRSIDIENQIIHKKLQKIKPEVGSVDKWKDQYHDYVNRRKHMSKYTEQGQGGEKINLQISRQKFLPNKYMQFLNDSTQEGERLTQNKKVVISNQKLLQLPPLPSHRTSRLKQDVSKLSISLKQ